MTSKQVIIKIQEDAKYYWANFNPYRLKLQAERFEIDRLKIPEEKLEIVNMQILMVKVEDGILIMPIVGYDENALCDQIDVRRTHLATEEEKEEIAKKIQEHANKLCNFLTKRE